ncbi:uncharacterized protein PFL1_05895 [Pseudozyma flocculosa PF-1]|uniref:Fork-head domain-containing protein n=2 Tax=Pseudozyma flocculosa TaxID=84751 RepID=A0A5C3F1T9_9BASI|nr:uncharacterized protein PFL1_05895 [Pseudozyma flocculosa PF-1]EPQ26574.1 hypothetical protein PFL1_05895 [Pseudozyma flocculosa PF-1]SPO38434.1 uncharacterized protein PSFLO_03912 [Pseudozyma flocculosa]
MEAALEAMYAAPGWAASNARRFYIEEWTRMLPGSPHQRPPYPYTEIIKIAILKSPQRRLTLSQLYAECSSKFPYFASVGTTDSWKNTLRHNLSTQRYFVKLNREVNAPGKGHYWTFDAQVEQDVVLSRRRRPQLSAHHSLASSPPSASTLTLQLSPVGPHQHPQQQPSTPESLWRSRTGSCSPLSRAHPYRYDSGGARGRPEGEFDASDDPRAARGLLLQGAWIDRFQRRDVGAGGGDGASHEVGAEHARSALAVEGDRGQETRILPPLASLSIQSYTELHPKRPRRSMSDHFLSHPIPTRAPSASIVSRRRGTS